MMELFADLDEVESQAKDMAPDERRRLRQDHAAPIARKLE
jgi:hypothetical protein